VLLIPKGSVGTTGRGRKTEGELANHVHLENSQGVYNFWKYWKSQ